jgi:hypothetical protein
MRFNPVDGAINPEPPTRRPNGKGFGPVERRRQDGRPTRQRIPTAVAATLLPAASGFPGLRADRPGIAQEGVWRAMGHDVRLLGCMRMVLAIPSHRDYAVRSVQSTWGGTDLRSSTISAPAGGFARIESAIGGAEDVGVLTQGVRRRQVLVKSRVLEDEADFVGPVPVTSRPERTLPDRATAARAPSW